jgi:hypothetical protein
MRRKELVWRRLWNIRSFKMLLRIILKKIYDIILGIFYFLIFILFIHKVD